jgi:hypothetical protein
LYRFDLKTGAPQSGHPSFPRGLGGPKAVKELTVILLDTSGSLAKQALMSTLCAAPGDIADNMPAPVQTRTLAIAPCTPCAKACIAGAAEGIGFFH